MSQESWSRFFGEDYLSFSEVILSPERTAFELEALMNVLQLREGMSVLDLGCGQGRMSVPLARRGVRVTGYDGSQSLLEAARQRAAEQGAEIEFVLGDMRELEFTARFDAVINIGTAFGYIAEASEDQDILRRIERSLKPGGFFLQETENRDFKLQHLHNTWNVMRDRIVFSQRQFDIATSRWREELCWFEQGDKKCAILDVRLYTAAELVRMTEAAGLSVQKLFGGFDLLPLTLRSPRMILLSRKM